MPSITSIIDSIATPPLAAMQQVLDTNGPFHAGDHTISTFHTDGAFLLPAGDYAVSGTYGVIVQATGVFPPGAGFTTGFNDGTLVGDPSGDEYELRIAQLVRIHQLPITGANVITDMEDINTLAKLLLWPGLLGGPSKIGLHVQPLWNVDLFWMCVL